MKRPRKNNLSATKKTQRTEAQKAQKATSLAMSALARLPADKGKRAELFAETARLKVEQQALSGKISQQQKRLKEVYGLTAETLQIRKILLDAPDGVYEATLKQVALLIRDTGRPFQMDMFDGEPGKGVADDTGSVFDTTGAGEKQAAERGDDPGKARKRSGPKPAPAAPSPGIPLDEAQKNFEKASAKSNGRKPANDTGKKAEGGYTEQLRQHNAEVQAELKAKRADNRGEMPDIPDELRRTPKPGTVPPGSEPPPAPRNDEVERTDDYRILQ